MSFDSKFGFHSIYPPCKPSDLSEFEETLPGGRLPSEYREFLLQWNGGLFGGVIVNVAFPVEDPEFDDEYGHVSQLFGLFDKDNGLDLRKSSLGYGFRAAVPPNYITIGDYGSWNQLCISVDGDDAGAVYYWAPGEPWPQEPPNTACLRRVASSFTQFWDLLFESDEAV